MRLTVRDKRDGVTVLGAALTSEAAATTLRYETRTGALLRIDGAVVSAFDREHGEAVVLATSGDLTLEVEDASLPTNALPSGPGLRWWWLNVRKHQEPARELMVGAGAAPAPYESDAPLWPVIGHGHLDVAWLWTYDEAARKAMRTFAIAANLASRYPEFIFSQSQPQLYAFAQAEDPKFFAELCALVKSGRLDATGAALWVEPDCNVPSGESLLRQMLYAREFCLEHFGIAPEVAWLPDSFGFCNTLPTLLAHAGIPYFVTTKLEWNDTTEFPLKQFSWEGPDGSAVAAALMAAYEGDVSQARIDGARERGEPLIAGYGDGGGGVTEAMIEQARGHARWTGPAAWMKTLSARPALPVHRGELYLEYHRGVYTTHHDVKARNAALERKLLHVEEALAWCVAVRAPRDMIAALCSRIDEAWRVVLRNQFHDVLPGTSIGRVYDDVREEYGEAEAAVDAVLTGTRNILPRGRPGAAQLERCEPVAQDDGGFLFDNGLVRAVASKAGIITELSAAGGRNVVSSANVLTLYADRPKRWEAWNIDADYAKRTRKPDAGVPAVRDGAVHIPFAYGQSKFEMRLYLYAGEPFLRVDVDCDWQTRRTLLRVENWLAVDSGEALYGTPHGTIARSARAATPQEQAQFEVPGQRFAAVRDASAGFVQFALDTYGWNARALPKGGIHLGHSLLRGTQWPDPDADRGRHHLRYAFAAFTTANTGALESAWNAFALEPRVKLFATTHDGVQIAACKPALDRDGVILRVRECDGVARTARVRSAGRVRAVEPCNGVEEPVPGEAPLLEGEHIVFPIGAYALRSFRVRFA